MTLRVDHALSLSAVVFEIARALVKVLCGCRVIGSASPFIALCAAAASSRTSSDCGGASEREGGREARRPHGGGGGGGEGGDDGRWLLAVERSAHGALAEGRSSRPESWLHLRSAAGAKGGPGRADEVEWHDAPMEHALSPHADLHRDERIE